MRWNKGRNINQQNNIMRRYISVSTETRRTLMKKYKVSNRTIWEACSFITKNKRGDSIRHDAMAMGGIYREEDFMPNCQTTFDTDGMHQRFATGVEVVLHENRMSILVPGRKDEHYYDVDLLSWGNILEKAQRIAEERMLKPSI